MIEHYDHDIIPYRIDALIILQGRSLALIICVLISILTRISYPKAVSILTVVYPKVVLTVVFILTVVSSLTETITHIFISAYSAVRVKIYAYVNMLDIK